MPAPGGEPAAEPGAGAGEWGRQEGRTDGQAVGQSSGHGRVAGRNCQVPGLAVSLTLQSSQQAGKLWRVSKGGHRQGFGVLEPLGTDPTSHRAPSWWKNWSGSSRAGSSWKASGRRQKATGRPR